MLICLEHEAALLRLEFSRYQIVPHRSPCYSATYSRCETIETYSPTVDPFPRVLTAPVSASPPADAKRFPCSARTYQTHRFPSPSRTAREGGFTDGYRL